MRIKLKLVLTREVYDRKMRGSKNGRGMEHKVEAKRGSLSGRQNTG